MTTRTFYYPITLSGRATWIDKSRFKDPMEGDILLGEPGHKQEPLKYSEVYDGDVWHNLQLPQLLGMALFTHRDHPHMGFNLTVLEMVIALCQGKLLQPNRKKGLYTLDLPEGAAVRVSEVAKIVRPKSG